MPYFVTVTVSRSKHVPGVADRTPIVLRNVSACGVFIAQFVSDRDVYTSLFVLLRGVVSPCIVSGVVDRHYNRNNKSVQMLQLWSLPSLALFLPTIFSNCHFISAGEPAGESFYGLRTIGGTANYGRSEHRKKNPLHACCHLHGQAAQGSKGPSTRAQNHPEDPLHRRSD